MRQVKLSFYEKKWRSVYSLEQANVRLNKSIQNYSLTDAIIFRDYEYRAELAYLLKLEHFSRQVYEGICTPTLSRKVHNSQINITYPSQFKEDFKELIGYGCYHFSAIDENNVGRLTKKKFSPYAEVLLAELKAFNNTVSVNDLQISDHNFDEIVTRVNSKLKSTYCRKSRELRAAFNSQVNSYVDYVNSLIRFYTNLRWVKVSLTIDFNPSNSPMERLNVIKTLRAKVANNTRNKKLLFRGYAGHICSLNVFSLDNPYLDVIYFFNTESRYFSHDSLQFDILNYWKPKDEKNFATVININCAARGFKYPNYSKVVDKCNSFNWSEDLLQWIIHLTTRHKFINSVDMTENVRKYVTRGERLRKVIY